MKLDMIGLDGWLRPTAESISLRVRKYVITFIKIKLPRVASAERLQCRNLRRREFRDKVSG